MIRRGPGRCLFKRAGCAALFGLMMAQSVVLTGSVQAQSLLIEQFPSAEQGSSALVISSAPEPNVWMSAFDDQDWSVECQNAQSKRAAEDEGRCRMIYRRAMETALERQNQPFEVTVERVILDQGAVAAAVVIIRTPMNLVLPQGLALQIDTGKPIRLAIRSCHVDTPADQVTAACFAPFRMTEMVKRALQRGNAMTVTAMSLSGEPVVQAVSLLGFTKTLAALK